MKFSKLGINKKSALLIMTGVLFAFGCTEDSEDSKIDFDRKAMLVHWYDKILLPAFLDFNTESQSLNNLTLVFGHQRDSTNLIALKTQYIQAYKSFQRIKAFEAGPSLDLSLRASLNTYPADTQKIASNIIANQTNLGSAQNIDAKGFPALDYLLNQTSISTWHTADSSLFLNYLKALSLDIKVLAQQNYTMWQGHRQSFINASGTDIGSSLGQMVNAINKDYELIKNAKIGFPAGKKTLGRTYPSASEAFYTPNLSMELAAINCEAIRFFYIGISFNGGIDGPSLEDYLIALGTQSFGENLDELIDNQFRNAVDAIRLIPAPFSLAIENHKGKVDSAYTAVQRNIISLKTDMPSAMGVLITYQDNDGD